MTLTYLSLLPPHLKIELEYATYSFVFQKIEFFGYFDLEFKQALSNAFE